jgi:hypothetical protein
MCRDVLISGAGHVASKLYPRFKSGGQHKPLILYCDNKASVFFSHNNKSSGAAKHIDLKYLVLRGRVQDHTINLEHISTKKILVDPLTKGLPPNIFQEHVADMGLLERH